MLAGRSAAPPASQPSSALETLATATWLHENGHHDAAQLILRHYLESDPANLQVRLEYARMLGFAQKYSEAVQQFQNVLRAEPGNLHAQAGLARVQSRQNTARRSASGSATPGQLTGGDAAEPEPFSEHKVLQAAVVAPAVGFVIMAGALLAYRRVRARGALGARPRPLRMPSAASTGRDRAPLPGPQSLRGGCFLLVERDAETRGLMQMVLTAGGAQVAACGSGEEAARLLAARDFDLLLLDSGLEGNWCAAEICAWLERSYPQGVRKAILMMSADPSALQQRLAAQSGAICLTRPFSAHDLEVISRLALARSRGAAPPPAIR